MDKLNLNYKVTPGSKVVGELIGPGDKSISQRVLIMASIADGNCNIDNLLNSADIKSCIEALISLGVVIRQHNDNIVVQGVGKYGLKQPKVAINCGNSGTCMRLLAGLLSAQRFSTVLTGDNSLCRRPMQRIITPLMQMGANIKAKNSLPPLIINGGATLSNIKYDIPIASAQVQTSLLLAALYAQEDSEINTLYPVRDHTQRMLAQFGCNISWQHNKTYIKGKQSLTATNIQIPVDFSSVIFFIVAALILPFAEITLYNVGINPGRIGALQVLKAMGANIECFNERVISGEPVADIKAATSKLHAVVIKQSDVALAIDEWPILLVAAACANGTTILRNAKELRYKETDRISAMSTGLRQLGVYIVDHEDGIEVVGIGNNSFFQTNNTVIQSYKDHRIAMAFAIAATKATKPIIIQETQSVATSFPGFIECSRKLGLNIKF